MADFTVLDNEVRDHFGSTSQDTTVSFTPAIGDLVFWFAPNSVNSGGDAAVSGGGMTWTKIAEVREASDTMTLFVFRATAGTPSAGVLTLSASDNWTDTNYAIIRPVDLTYVGVAGSESSNNALVQSLTIALATTSPAALLGYAAFNANPELFAADTGWTAIVNEQVASGGAQTVQERFSDDTEWIVDDASGGANSHILFGVVLEFDAAGGGGGSSHTPRSYPRGVNRGVMRGAL